MGTVTRTVTVVPSGYTGTSNITVVTTAGTTCITNGYKGSGDTSSTARLSVSNRATGYLYFTFDCSDIIPSGATITSVTGTVTVRVNYTSRVTNTVCQLYTGTTAKGSNVTFASTSTSNTVTLSAGTGWTRADLNDLRLRIGGTGASSSSRYIYFAGASITITYTVTTYDITIENDTAAIVTVDNDAPLAGDSVTITSDTYAFTIFKDNGVDVTNQFTSTVISGETFYIYTISNVSENHIVTVTSTSTGDPPAIKVGTPSRTIISDETGYDQSVCTFTSDLALVRWEARATKAGVTPARGVGLLVESGGALAAKTAATIYVENEELTNGDGIYTITVYGQSTGGVWSDYYEEALIGQAIVGTAVVTKQ